ncbi:MAG: ATP-binding protein [Desulfoprunum sp.]|nr:ATP-binding protein [Desulfoprunum sp.]
MKKKKILVIDNDREFLQGMTELLEGHGHTTVAVTDVLASLDVLVEYTPEIIFIDLLLPRIGGDDFCRILRNIDYLRTCYIVILSGIAAEQQFDFQVLGANACIAKSPFKIMSEHILEVIRASEGPLPPGNIVEVMGLDSCHFRQVTKDLLSKNKSLKTILESMSQGIIEIYGRRVVYANSRALSFLALPFEKVLGAYIADIFPDHVWNKISSLLEGDRHDDMTEEHYVPVRIHERHILVHLLLVMEQKNCQIMLLSDVTEIRKMESVVEATNLTDKLGYIFSGIRHEIGNPVNSIKVALSVLQKNLATYDRATVAEFLDRSLIEVARIEYLLKALKNYSLFESPDIQRFRIDTFMENFVPLVREDFAKRKVDLKVMCADDARWILADPRALHQVLLNLLTNAADAIDGREDGRIIISIMKSDRWVEIKVDDNGHGISEADQKNLFRPFFTSKKNGTGLGLVIVRKMLRQMHGRINVTSYKGFGATVTIAIPEAEQDGRVF